MRIAVFVRFLTDHYFLSRASLISTNFELRMMLTNIVGGEAVAAQTTRQMQNEFTALMGASVHGHGNCVSLLLESGGDKNAVDAVRGSTYICRCL